MRVVFLGPPGAGKGTQAKFVEEEYGACQVATGEILRKAAREQSSLGKRAKQYMDRGELVPDDIMVDLVAERLREEDCKKGFILDGFPRTIAQADSLESVLRKLGSGIDAVVAIQAPREVILERLSGRRTCKHCGKQYHETFQPPKREESCDCGGDLMQRDDDREETIASRLEVYERQTAPLIDYYRKRGYLKMIDGVGDVEQIRSRVLQALREVEQ